MPRSSSVCGGPRADESGGGRFDWEVEYASRLYLTAFDDARYENVFHAGAGASTDAAA